MFCRLRESFWVVSFVSSPSELLFVFLLLGNLRVPVSERYSVCLPTQTEANDSQDSWKPFGVVKFLQFRSSWTRFPARSSQPQTRSVLAAMVPRMRTRKDGPK